MQPVQMIAGETLWRSGNRCRHFYILRQGLVQYEVPRSDLEKFKQLPITQQRKEELAEIARDEKKKEIINESEHHPSKYAVVSSKSRKRTLRRKKTLSRIHVPIGVYTDGAHFGDERVRYFLFFFF